MNDHKNLLHHIADWWQSRQERPHTANWSRWLPTPGNIFFTLLMIGLLIFTQQTWATNGPESVNVPGPSATTVNYQGRLAAPDGTPKNGTFGMSFAIYDAASGGNVVWGAESHTAVPVTDGLFNVGLGSQTSGGIPITVWNGDRYVQITVGGEILSPRELIRSVPVAGMALTVPDNSLTTEKFTDTAVGKWIMWETPIQIGQTQNSPTFNWQTMDISGYIPDQATVVYLQFWVTDNSSNGWCRIRPNGATMTPLEIRTPVAYVTQVTSGMVPNNSSQELQYKCDFTSTGSITVQLWGYYEPGH